MGRQQDALKSLLKQMQRKSSEERNAQLQLSSSLPHGALTLDQIEGGRLTEARSHEQLDPLPALMTKALTLEEIERQMTSGLE